MAACSLTDEEKRKLDTLLVDIDTIITEGDNNDQQVAIYHREESEDEDDDEDLQITAANGFTVTHCDQDRLQEIEKELKKFNVDRDHDGDKEKAAEDSLTTKDEALTVKISKGVRNSSVAMSEKKCFREFLMEHDLKDVEKRLRDVEEMYSRDEVLREKLMERRQLMEKNRAEEGLNEDLVEVADVTRGGTNDVEEVAMRSVECGKDLPK